MNLKTVDRKKLVEAEPLFSEVENNFSRAFRKIAEPFALWSNAAFIYLSSADKVVSRIGRTLLCASYESVCENNFCGENHFISEVKHDEINLGRVVLCCAENSPDTVVILEKLIGLAKEELSKIEDEAALLAELSASWESLQAVYDLNADFSSFEDPTYLLKKITERTTAISGKIQSVLWLESNEHLAPAAANCRYEVKARDKNYGLIGESFAKKRSTIFNEASKIEKYEANENELASAKRLAMVPLTTHLATYGVLVVWLETEDFAFDSRTMRLLDTLALQAAMVVENERLHRESIQNAKLNKEIEIGSKIQQTLLSGTPPENLEKIRIAASSISSQEIDGDFYDFIEHDADCFDLIVGDVMGKGIPAALVGAATKNSFLRAIANLQASEKSFRPQPEKIVTFVNQKVTPKLIKFERFVTACYTRFELEKNEITFVDCGHTKTIHFKARERKISLLEGENLPLGFSEHEIFQQKTVRVKNGDLLFFYSDGVTETINPKKELFGDERLKTFIAENWRLEPEDLISQLLKKLYEFSTVDKFSDDLTCVAVRIGTVSAGGEKAL